MILRTMATTRLWTLSALLAAVLSPGSASAAEQVARLETSRAEHPLARLQFKNLGMVRADMQFQEKRQPCYYVESPTAWSVPWGSGAGGSSYPYLWLVDRAAPSGGSGAVGPRLAPPPLGMRSAVPLGGLGAGTIELRADGSLCDWNIFNNSPGGGGGKVQLEDCLLGLRVRPEAGPARAWTVRTHPPHGLPSVLQIDYSGAFPVSRLRLRDPQLPLTVELYAYSELKIRDARASATPAVVFSFLVTNPLDRPVEAAVLCNLPNHVAGEFSAAGRLVLTRNDNSAIGGTMALGVGDGLACSCATADDLHAIWKTFADTGRLGGVPLGSRAKNGAITASVTLRPGETKTVSLVLAWHFPYRTHFSNRQRTGNYYAKLYKDAGEVAEKVLGRLPGTWQNLLQWQKLCFDNGLPDWLQDALLNSLGTMAKTGMWTEDGRWRQWESFSCPAVDPLHIHFYRSLPYVLLFPELQKSQLRAYASIQKPDGFINEDLGNAGRRMDDSQARGMGDCTSAFVLALYEHYLWTNDRKLLDALWPHARKATLWQIERARRYGLPDRLNNTYDWWGFDGKDVVAYNAIMQLAALRAAAQLAKIEGDEAFAGRCTTEFAAAQKKTDELLWTGEYYRAWWMHGGGQTPAIHADTLYGQLWASMLGLGWLVEPEKVRAIWPPRRSITPAPSA